MATMRQPTEEKVAGRERRHASGIAAKKQIQESGSMVDGTERKGRRVPEDIEMQRDAQLILRAYLSGICKERGERVALA